MEKPDFGKRLIEVRKAQGLTQDEVAEKCNVTVRTIQRIESGQVKPRAYTIKVIGEVLGFDFFETPDTGYDVEIKSRRSNLKEHAVILYVKDLFNFKTNAMKKISILAAFFLVVGAAVFMCVSETNAQPPVKEEEKSTMYAVRRLNYIKTKDWIEVAFTNEFTFDSLVYIKNDLKERGILIQYKEIKFDKNDRLISISCEVDCQDGFKGSFSAVDLLRDESKRIGFYRNYDKNAKISFGTGLID